MSDATAFDRTVQLMKDRLDLNTVNHKVISSNLANINTPGYVAKKVPFEEILSGFLEEDRLHLLKTDPKHLGDGDPHLAMKSPPISLKGPVSLDEEMAELSRNSLEYQYVLTMLNKKIAMLKRTINEGEA